MVQAGRQHGALTRAVLPFLLLLSGFCGISYEILYSKLLGNLLGSQFIINATVLLSFLLGIGVGTLYAHRFARFLWLIEAGIGIYAALMALFYPAIDTFLYKSIPVLGTNILAAAGVAFALLLAPAFLIGCSVPLFAGYLAALRSSHVFSLTYGVYNIGAAMTALGMEFVLLREVGLRSSTVILATLNIVVAAGLLLLTRRAGLAPVASADHVRFPSRVLAALALASVVSAIFQLMMIKLAEFVFGPYNETFSLVLATVLFGLSVGAFAAGRLRVSFARALLLALAGLVWILTGTGVAVAAYATFYSAAAEGYWTLVALKLALIVVLMALPSVGFGATIPALLNVHKDVARESGQLLFCSSVANAFGFLLMAFVLHRYFDYGPLILLLTVLLTVALALHGATRRALIAALLLLAMSGGAYATMWDETLLYVGHKSFHSIQDLRKEKGRPLMAQRFKGPQDVFAIISKDDKPYFFINGYISIPLRSSSEKLVGAMAAMLAPRLDEALVLGMGSGGTAGTVGLLYEHTDVVEINKVVLQNLYRMSEYNFDIENMPGVDIIHDDGIHFIKTTPKRYSLILNTVTTPLYFSSSKLYTRDFLELVSRRLTPDGLYITWVDGRIGDNGIDIVLHTLDESFETCWQTYLKSNYYIMACSNEPIQVRNLDAVVANDTLGRYMTGEHQMPLRLLPYSVISLDAANLTADREIPVNTLDYPVLEFEMARLQRDNLRGFKSRLRDNLDFREVDRRLDEVMDWKAGEFLFFADLRTDDDSTLSSVLFDVVPSQFESPYDDYARIALDVGGEMNSAKAYAAYGRRLTWRGRHAEAALAFSRALELEPDRNNVHERLGRAYYEMGEYEQALQHFLAEWDRDNDDDVPIGAARALIKLERYDDALPWLDVALETGEEGAERVDYLRGVAYEGLDDDVSAERHYRQALDRDPEYESAREALQRLRGAREG